MENKLKVPNMYRFPKVDMVTWFAAQQLVQRYQSREVSETLCPGIVALYKALVRKVQSIGKSENKVSENFPVKEV